LTKLQPAIQQLTFWPTLYISVLVVAQLCDDVLCSGTVVKDVHGPLPGLPAGGILRWNEDGVGVAVSSTTTNGVGDETVGLTTMCWRQSTTGRNTDSGFHPANAYAGGRSVTYHLCWLSNYMSKTRRFCPMGKLKYTNEDR